MFTRFTMRRSPRTLLLFLALTWAFGCPVIADADDKARGAATVKGTESKETAHFACPMKCEGEKKYGGPGTCPVCNMHLKQLDAGVYRAQVTPREKALAPGKAEMLEIRLLDPDGKLVKNLEVVHEKILHLLVVSKDLSWYAHEHPDIQKDGSFTIALTFPAPGAYFLYHDFTPQRVGQQVVRAEITVAGSPPKSVPLAIDMDRSKSADGVAVTLKTDGALTADVDETLTFALSANGKPVTDLEHYLGAMGHLVIISQDLEHFVHSHPLEESHGHEGHATGSKHVTKPGGPEVSFHATFPAAGRYKGWGQFQRSGRVLTVPFTFDVKAGEDPKAKGAPSHQGHGG